MHSIFDNEYLGKPCTEQHQREIREDIARRRLAQEVQSTNLRSKFVEPAGLLVRQAKMLIAECVRQAQRFRNRQSITVAIPRAGQEQSGAKS